MGKKVRLKRPYKHTLIVANSKGERCIVHGGETIEVDDDVAMNLVTRKGSSVEAVGWNPEDSLSSKDKPKDEQEKSDQEPTKEKNDPKNTGLMEPKSQGQTRPKGNEVENKKESK